MEFWLRPWVIIFPSLVATLCVSVLAQDAAIVAEEQVLVSFGSEWAYHDSGSSPGDDWETRGFDDASWSRGLAELGYGDGDESTVVTTNLISYRFRHTFEVQDVSRFSALNLALRYDDAVVVYLNGTEIYRTSLMPREFDRFTVATDHVVVDNTVDEVTLESAASLLENGENVIAAQVHNSSQTSSDASFDLALTGVIRSNEGPGALPAGSTNSTSDDSPAPASAGSPIVPIIVAVVAVIAIAIIVPVALLGKEGSGKKASTAEGAAEKPVKKKPASSDPEPKRTAARTYPAPKALPPKPKVPPPKPKH